jgi:pimeloyl-ACP methyl ester carboxylesterase
VTPVVAFVHGLVLDDLASFYYTIAGPVAAAGARVVLYDLRGHGLSERTSTGYTAADSVADLFAVLDALGCDQPVYLVSNSFGGLVSLQAALARPDRIAGMVLIEAYGPAEHRGLWAEDLLNTLNKNALTLEYERHPDQYRALGWRRPARQAATAGALLNGTSLLRDLAAAEPISAARLSALACPVLAVYGEQSDVAHNGRILARAVPGCVLHLVPGVAHTVLSEASPALLEVMLPWLARHAGTRLPAS